MEATIRPGTLLYFDSLTAGLIPCQVRKVWRDNDHLCIDAVCTATRKWCKRGETLCDATDGKQRCTSCQGKQFTLGHINIASVPISGLCRAT